ncbi:pseudouridylate synthase TRUB2, mitochondrial-like [Ylistrum balloti]|uniref:pseudouridylate synthase TRUB2, mitochondrial-like n=1 Tax=Ylistrum balloti TaxID=509963 RepID=UPI002905A947|nr:pseudouridylate synthase TRUB2, mitochondrial-like [Ylistrum balloti]
MPFKFKSGEHALRNLHGYFCVYKPEGMRMADLVQTLQTKLLQEINALPNYLFETTNPRLQAGSPSLAEGHANAKPDLLAAGSTEKSVVGMDSNLTTNSTSDSLTFSSEQQLMEAEIMNNRLVLGDRYEPEDLRLFANTGLARYSSGLVVIGSGTYKYRTKKLSSRYIQVYHVKGLLGWASDSYSTKGRIVERSTFSHVNTSLVEKVCAAVEATHQRKMFDYAGVNPESQEAYELATQGLLRPQMHITEPIIYSIKCVAFDPPYFTLEIHAINERCYFLAEVIHNFGLLMKTTAVCAGIRRIRSGVYDISYALLYQDWELNKITGNIKDCKLIRPPSHLERLSPTLGYLNKDNKGVFRRMMKQPQVSPALSVSERIRMKEELIATKKMKKEVQKFLSSKLNEEEPEVIDGEVKE